MKDAILKRIGSSISDAKPPNQWNTLPKYWEAEVDAVSHLTRRPEGRFRKPRPSRGGFRPDKTHGSLPRSHTPEASSRGSFRRLVGTTAWSWRGTRTQRPTRDSSTLQVPATTRWRRPPGPSRKATAEGLPPEWSVM